MTFIKLFILVPSLTYVLNITFHGSSFINILPKEFKLLFILLNKLISLINIKKYIYEQ